MLPLVIAFGEPAPAAQEGVYLASLAGRLKPSTIIRRLAAVSVRHRELGHPLDTRDPAIRATLQGIRRTHRVTTRGKAALMTATIKELAEATPASLHGIRDRALILFGFALGHRRSTLVALDIEDLQFVTESVVVTIRRSKTDQEGQGIKVGIPHGRGRTCPVRAIKEWIAAAELTEGPVFRAIAATDEVLEDAPHAEPWSFMPA